MAHPRLRSAGRQRFPTPGAACYTYRSYSGWGRVVGEKIWLKQYSPGVPAEADIEAFRSVKQIIERSCAEFRDLPAYSNMGVSLSYGEVDQQSRYFAAYLQKVVGVKKGDRVALMSPNCLQYPIALFGVLRAGGTVVNCNPLYTPRELEHQLKDSGAIALVVLENFAHTYQAVKDAVPVRTVITTQLGDAFPPLKRVLVNFVVKHVKKMVPAWSIPGATSFRAALAHGKWQELDEVDVALTDVAFLQYTGGTTGVSKGAVLTHGNMVANMQQAHAWLAPKLSVGQETIITALPLYHIFSLTANCLVFMKIGGHNVLITNPRDFAGFVKELTKTKWTVITGVNTLYNALMNTPGFDRIDFSRVKLALGGGMAVQRAVAERWKQMTGSPLLEAYGLTETSPAACINPLTNTEFNGSIGLPISSTEVSIRDDDFKELPIRAKGAAEAGTVGEICIRGPQVMRGYWNRQDETDKVLTKDGWLKTGDLGYMDPQGYIYIVDRKKDMILVSGFNVYPNEVEGVVAMHPGVLEVAAVGVPDERSGEAVKIFVVKKDPNLTEQALIEFCKKELTGYKIPHLVEFRTELPKTNVGKILRRALRDAPAAK
jgi:long-chain acyl-CoA synthetase